MAYAERRTAAGVSLTPPGPGLYLMRLQHGVTACLLGIPGLEDNQGAALTLSWLHVSL